MIRRYWDTVNKTEKIFKATPETLPEGVVELPNDHIAWQTPPADKVVAYDGNGLPIFIDKPAPPPPTFEDLQTAKADEARRLYTAAMNHTDVLGEYSQREIDTFHEQAREAVAYLAELETTTGGDTHAEINPANYPMLDAIAGQHTDRKLEDQVNRVVSKRSAFNAYCGAVTGKHQAICEAINACTTQSELDAIDVTEITTFAEGLLGG